MSTFPTIVSYYTEGTSYEREVKNLIASCEKWSLPYEIDPIPSKGSWEKNCCYKPKYLLEKLAALKAPLLWVDADAVIAQKPTLFSSLSVDIALRVIENYPNNSPSKMISGTIYINQTDKAKTILTRWNTLCQKMLAENKEEVWDQVALRDVLLSSDATVYPLPRAYYTIYDTMTTKRCKEEAIIIHYQASRIFKKEINDLVTPFWEADASSQDARKAFLSKFNTNTST